MKALLDEQLNNTFSWDRDGEALCTIRDGMLARVGSAVDAGPGAFVTDADPEPGFNAYAGAPGYYEAVMGRDIGYSMPYAEVGVNPWDHVFGPIVADDGIGPVAARRIGSQSGEESM